MSNFSLEMILIPTVSVIIPTYNRAHFIGEAISSVLSQTYPDFEIIVIDDGSSDETEKVVGGFSDPRVVYLKQVNLGRSRARNSGFLLARGRYIAFLDSDDLYLPEKLAIQVAYLDRHPDVGMVYTSAFCIDYAGEALRDNYVASVSGRIYKSIAFFRPVTITLPTVMARRELFDEVGVFDEEMHRFEDTDMWRRISKATIIDGLPDFTCKLRTHSDNSLSSQDPGQIIASLDYYAKKILREDRKIGWRSLRHGLGGLYFYYGRAFLTVPKWRSQGVYLLQKACVYWPLYALKYVLIRLHAIVFK